ncbi:hypothetical protein SISNIDRAFT_470955 [Sistotremastrum niveocremeum HHB9708]|uniref:Uncharacterized protein n=1 Tax=Sistotremastrum niveocremeum HHB9708 TaxID=1314777 RepID=A0A164N9K5_9AGAM|nr:hypothetical protein SISNIDRAFT_470955 [Sistotremastrum niveocremeum HHB9708]
MSPPSHQIHAANASSWTSTPGRRLRTTEKHNNDAGYPAEVQADDEPWNIISSPSVSYGIFVSGDPILDSNPRNVGSFAHGIVQQNPMYSNSYNPTITSSSPPIIDSTNSYPYHQFLVGAESAASNPIDFLNFRQLQNPDERRQSESRDDWVCLTNVPGASSILQQDIPTNTPQDMEMQDFSGPRSIASPPPVTLVEAKPSPPQPDPKIIKANTDKRNKRNRIENKARKRVQDIETAHARVAEAFHASSRFDGFGPPLDQKTKINTLRYNLHLLKLLCVVYPTFNDLSRKINGVSPLAPDHEKQQAFSEVQMMFRFCQKDVEAAYLGKGATDDGIVAEILAEL